MAPVAKRAHGSENVGSAGSVGIAKVFLPSRVRTVGIVRICDAFVVWAAIQQFQNHRMGRLHLRAPMVLEMLELLELLELPRFGCIPVLELLELLEFARLTAFTCGAPLSKSSTRSTT